MVSDQTFLQNKLNLAIKLFNTNKLDEAIECFKYLEKNQSTNKIAILYLGIIEIRKNNTKSAKEYFYKILDLDKNHEMANLNLGLVFFQEKNFEKTYFYLNNVLKINNENTLAKYNLGLLDLFSRKYENAIRIFNEILIKEPKNINILNNLGICYLKKMQFEKATDIFQNCLEIDNNNRFAILNIANAYFKSQKFEKAIEYYNKVLIIDKHHIISKIGLSKCYFALHQFDKALELYEVRKKGQTSKIKIINNLIKKFDCKEWMGEPIKNKTILILSEQGIGDNIQFARYIFWLKEKFNCNIVFYINEKNSHLFENCPCEIETKIENIKKVDFFQHLLSLQYIHFKKEKTFKKCISFIPSEVKKEQEWKKKLNYLKKPVIAIQWKGNKNFLDDQERSIPLKYFEKLIKDKNYSFISLQKDNGSEEIKENNFQKYINDFSDQIDFGNKSFDDTISILKNVDLLISADTGLKEIALTMGIKTFLLLNPNPDWRWHIQLKEKSFYDDLKIIMTDKMNYWDNISDSILKELKKI